MEDNIQVLELTIPREIENLKLPSPDMLDLYQDRKNRIIYIDYDIDENLLREVGRQILEYNRTDYGKPVDERKPIVMLINSGGGNLDSTYATIAIMETSKTPIVTVNMNCAYSAAGLILMAGHKRYCMPRSQVLIHSGSAQGIGGDYESVQESTKSYKKMVEEMREFITSKTRIEKSLMKKNQARDWYLDTKEQIDLGVVDAVLSDIDSIL
jgi:ATP-dependent Clp protease protease subunit